MTNRGSELRELREYVLQPLPILDTYLWTLSYNEFICPVNYTTI